MHEAGADGVGIVLNLTPVLPETEAAAEAADGVDAIRNRVWLGPLVDGAYDAGTLRVAPVLEDPDLVRPGDLDLVRGSADWLGVNYYTPARVAEATGESATDRHRGRRRRRRLPRRRGLPVRASPPAHRHGLGGRRRQPRAAAGRHPPAHGLPLVVTENGAAYADTTVLPDGSVDDADRIDYLESHLAAIDAARDAGADVRGWLVWTLMDNFEWSHGYTKTFGLVSVDRSTCVVRRRGPTTGSPTWSDSAGPEAVRAGYGAPAPPPRKLLPMTGIKDVAREVGVSTATVSRALRGLPRVSPETRERVLEVATRMGYVASPHAASLASGQTHAIGVVVPNVTRWFFGSVVHGARSCCARRATTSCSTRSPASRPRGSGCSTPTCSASGWTR